MVYFRDYHWLPVQGYSRFEALIQTEDRKREDVFWMMQLRCVASGPEWRRVRYYHRPSLWLQVSSFKPKLRDWTDLGHLNFWDSDEQEHDTFVGPGGVLDLDFYPEKCSKDGAHENSYFNQALWRVAGREGGWLTVELAGFFEADNLRKQRDSLEVRVTPDGREERVEPDAEFWRRNAELYLVENIPFGTVTVHVPRNARDPEAYALNRARLLIGVGEPEHIQVRDQLKVSERTKKECSENSRQDIFVTLHFNGFHEA